ncbi:PTS sugar transporter subunit IIA [Lentzea aerocolonigenes]|uniref:PTS sugar transporter subunit IIA n=1 Tax=Lentzea aerocolonigenes TaxID=68170 RepID=UPI0004C3F2CF|nr:PTS sugar transporter subunit IIA [Lentzea aerocolonigenes]MCP2246896.1 PTS system, mannose-specific IIB component [Lentzea aerocolonigenes]
MTIPVVLAGHGALPSGVAGAAELVLGPQSRLAVCELGPAEDPDSYGERLAALTGDAAVLVLVDLPGGTPANRAKLLAARREGMRIVTGLNLPMVLEVLVRNGDVDELAGRALSAGRDGVLVEPVLTR